MNIFNKVKSYKFAKSILLLLGILFTQLVSHAGTLKINISGLKNNKGFIELVIYKNEKNFPKEGAHYKLYKLKIANKQSVLSIKNMPEGTYAIALMHDENSNKKMDKNILGMPKEGFGFSNNPRVVFKEPTYNECKFNVKASEKLVSIKMIYF